MSKEIQGEYTCTPFNIHGTAGSSGTMEVLVREPPTFVTRPSPVHQRKIDDDVQMNCKGQGTPNPTVTWTRVTSVTTITLKRFRKKKKKNNFNVDNQNFNLFLTLKTPEKHNFDTFDLSNAWTTEILTFWLIKQFK